MSTQKLFGLLAFTKPDTLTWDRRAKSISGPGRNNDSFDSVDMFSGIQMVTLRTAQFRNATIEKEFFSQGSRMSLSPKMPGIRAFKPRLSTILKTRSCLSFRSSFVTLREILVIGEHVGPPARGEGTTARATALPDTRQPIVLFHSQSYPRRGIRALNLRRRNDPCRLEEANSSCGPGRAF